MINKDEFLFHNLVVAEFSRKLLDSVFTEDNIVSKKKAILIKGDKPQKIYGYYMEKNKKSYFLIDELVDKLPFKITKSVETDYKGDVFDMITHVFPITIPAEQRMSFRELVLNTPSFTHTNPKHYLLYKILSLAAYVDRLNARISTEAGFGKDSTIDIIKQLVNSTSNIYGATFAKLEYNLTNRLLCLNEMGNLKTDEKFNMQEYLLAVGAYRNYYEKRTRKTNTTQETYDVSDTSLLILYNLPEYYRDKAQEYFDQMFTPAVIDRFIPFVFDGRLATKFQDLLDPYEVLDTHEDKIKDIIATLEFYKVNKLTELKYEIPEEIDFGNKERYDRTFCILAKYVAEFSESEEEFKDLILELYKCYKNYDTLIETEKVVDELK